MAAAAVQGPRQLEGHALVGAVDSVCQRPHWARQVQVQGHLPRYRNNRHTVRRVADQRDVAHSRATQYTDMQCEAFPMDQPRALP